MHMHRQPMSSCDTVMTVACCSRGRRLLLQPAHTHTCAGSSGRCTRPVPRLLRFRAQIDTPALTSAWLMVLAACAPSAATMTRPASMPTAGALRSDHTATRMSDPGRPVYLHALVSALPMHCCTRNGYNNRGDGDHPRVLAQPATLRFLLPESPQRLLRVYLATRYVVGEAAVLAAMGRRFFAESAVTQGESE